MLLQHLQKSGAIHPPKWLIANAQFLTIMGSDAYGVSAGGSDLDLYGFCIPPKDLIFPSQFGGEIPGFGRQIQRFEVWQEHHIQNPDGKDVQYDISVFSIVKYFNLCMENNPNMIDSLFTPRRCVLHSTKIGEHVRENRQKFLHKGAFHKFKGYAYANFHKYRLDRKEKLRAVIAFQNEHAISSSDIINSLRRELARRGLDDGKQSE